MRRIKEQGQANEARIKTDAVGKHIDFNGIKIYTFTTAITSGVTATTAAAGSFGMTSHATGRGVIFGVADGKWAAQTVTLDTDPLMAADSDDVAPSQAAVVAYVAAQIAAIP